MIRAALICLMLAAPAAAQDAVATQTAAAAARLSEAAELLADAPHGDNPVLTLAAAVRAYEDGLIAVRAGLQETTTQYDALRSDLSEKRAEISQLLIALKAVETAPAPTLAVHPRGARAAVQAQMVQAVLTPALATDAQALRDQLAQLGKVTALQDAATETLAEGQAGLTDALAGLQRALNDQPPPSRFAEDPAVIAALLDAATTRDLFVNSLARLYAGGLPNDATLAGKGALPLPVTGRPLTGDADAIGLILATPAGALLVAPTSATILYQGPLPGFDLGIVLEPTAGTTFVFAGLSQSFGKAGQLVPAGWPLGLVAETIPAPDTNLTTNPASETGNGSQALYLEVRDGQSLVDPATWFALEQQMDVQ